MTAPLAPAPPRAHFTHNMDVQAALQKVLETSPGSIRALAREAGVSEALLRAVRDGERRLTRETRDALASALRRWKTRCEEALEALEAADLESPTGGDDA